MLNRISATDGAYEVGMDRRALFHKPVIDQFQGSPCGQHRIGNDENLFLRLYGTGIFHIHREVIPLDILAVGRHKG